jgi:membrane protease YdiL (CAAX protease family)
MDPLDPLEPLDPLDPGWDTPTDPPIPGPAPPLPKRYALRRGERDGHLVCDEAPRIRVRMSREHTFSEAEARELGERVILLDGAGSFAPLLDNKRRLYNLDHHQGCERTFTLATCEQALLLVRSGLDLSEGDWTVYANEPDLDTLLALWCLLNHARLRDLRPTSRDILLPMIRLEGAIDANGNELAEVCGLPADILRETQQRLDDLLVYEHRARQGGQWQALDIEAYTVEMLGQIDRIIYSIDDFRGYGSIQEVYGHTEIGERRVAVVCHDSAGIYAVEKLLKERWGDQLGVIALEKEPGHYTLRRAATLSDIDLNDAYDILNLLDHNVDGRPPGKCWGGSDNIGGSPRPTGSALGPSQLLQVLGRAYRRPTVGQRLLALAHMTLLVIGLGAFGVVAGLGGGAIPQVASRLGDETARMATFGLFVGAASVLLSWLFSGRRLWLYGWPRPAGSDWLPLGIVATLAALPARAWFPQPASLDPGAVAFAVGAVALAAVAVESCFRGLVHGLLQIDSRVQRVGGAWRISAAAWVSAGLYALLVVALSLPDIWLDPSPLLPPLQEVVMVAGASTLGGLALALMRERSRSLWPGILAQTLGGVGCAAFWFWVWLAA